MARFTDWLASLTTASSLGGTEKVFVRQGSAARQTTTADIAALAGAKTTEEIQDLVGAMLAAGTNMTVTYNDGAGTITLDAAGGGGGLTTEQVQDLVAAMITAGTNVTATYDDGAGTLTLDASGGGGGLTTEQVQDAVAAMLVEGDNVTLTYDDGAGTLTVGAASGGGGGAGSSWTKVVDESGAALTNWTSVSGTWASDGTKISQSDGGGNYRALTYNTKTSCSEAIIEFELYYPATGFAGVGFGRFGVNWGPANSVGPQFLCVSGTSLRWRSEENGSSVSLTETTTASTWTHFRLHVVGGSCAVWKDNTYLGTLVAVVGAFSLDSLQLVSYGTTASWRNIEMWVPDVADITSGITANTGFPFRKVVDEPGSSLADWLQNSTFITTDGSTFLATSASQSVVGYNAVASMGLMQIIQAEVQFVSIDAPGAVVGIGVGAAGDTSPLALVLEAQWGASAAKVSVADYNLSNFLEVEQDDFVVGRWYTLRAVIVGGHWEVWVDGVQVGTAVDVGMGPYLQIVAFNAHVKWRNIKAWNAVLGETDGPVEPDDASLWAVDTDNEEFDRDNITSLPTGWSWLNQGSSTYLERFGAGTVTLAAGSNTYDWRGIYKTGTLTDGQSVVARLVGVQRGNNLNHQYRQAIILRSSSASNFCAFSIYLSDASLGAETSYVDIWTGPTAYGSTLTSSTVPFGCQYMKITRTSSTSYGFHLSPDGCAWVPVATGVNLSSYGFDQIGFAAMCHSTGFSSIACHWLRFE